MLDQFYFQAKTPCYSVSLRKTKTSCLLLLFINTSLVQDLHYPERYLAPQYTLVRKRTNFVLSLVDPALSREQITSVAKNPHTTLPAGLAVYQDNYSLFCHSEFSVFIGPFCNKRINLPRP